MAKELSPQAAKRRKRINACKTLIRNTLKALSREPTLDEVMEHCECSRPTAIETKSMALLEISGDTRDATPKRNPRAKSDGAITLDAMERLDLTKRMVAAALAEGRELTVAEVGKACGVQPPKARQLRSKATAMLAEENAAKAVKRRGGEPIKAELMPSPGQAIANAPTPVTSASEDGIDMLGTLQKSARKLNEIARELQSDIQHARFFILGVPEKGHMPGYCRACGTEMAEQLTVQHKPAGLQVTFSDLASLARAAVQTELASGKIVDSYNTVLAQMYNYAAMQNYISNVKQAILNVVPERARDLAAELKRLQSLAGGVHGN